MKQLVHDAMRHYPLLQNVRQRWVLVDAAPSILAEVPRQLADYTADHLRRDGVEISDSTTLASVEARAITLSDGVQIPTETVVWTAGVTANPLIAGLGLPLDERGRICVDSRLRVEGHSDIWALGDNAQVPNDATPGKHDPPTCQHALRQARTLADGLRGNPRRYDYRSIGEGATLGRDVGIARVFGLHLRGRLGGFITRVYHVQSVPLGSRRLRILTDGILSMLFRRDITELSLHEAAAVASEAAR